VATRLTINYFNFGNFDDVLTRNASPREFAIALSIKYPDIDKRERGRIQNVRDYFVELDLSYSKTSVGAPIVQTFAMRGEDRTFRLERGEKGAYKLFVDDEPSIGQSRNFAPERSIALSVEALQKLGPDAAVAQDLSLVLRRELESIAYLGPLRKKPERDYAWNRSRPGLMGADGSGVMNALLASVYARGEATQDMHSGLSGGLQAGGHDGSWRSALGAESKHPLFLHSLGIPAQHPSLQKLRYFRLQPQKLSS
jgi:hypothetical protein